MKAKSVLPRHSADSVVAVRNGEIIDARRFYRDFAWWSQRLPDRPYVVNICEDKYLFFVGLVTAAARGQITLLPHSTAPEAFAATIQQFEGVTCLADCAPPVSGLDILDMREDPGDATPMEPFIPAERTVAITFTSGSTGVPSGHPKTWGFLMASASIIGSRLGSICQDGFTAVSTVPHQHMYGLEHSICAPLKLGGSFHAGRPFLPDDIRAALSASPRPRALVTTPPHLRACLTENGSFPELDFIVSATAPLDKETALAVEKLFSCRLLEIYGCTEAGSIASRQTARESLWKTLDGLSVTENQGEAFAVATHLPGPIPLADIMDIRGPETFSIRGRIADMVKVGGKRVALGDLNHHLVEIPGVVDGVYFAPDGLDENNGRLVAFVAEPSVSNETILSHLRKWIDPVFMPRRIYRVESLPREKTGKIPRSELVRLAAEAKKRCG
ncbi:MAG: acyl-CoA synthetase [Nitrospinae bacterium]|nr:acyl-CoA synthetase [Nitrospinota bacterium]MBF0633825.1 acyl-CoA synthetase [Nitrospinota bacterium]